MLTEAAVYKIGLDWDEVQKQPRLTAILAEAKGGLVEVAQALRFSDNPVILQFLKVYDKGTDVDRRVVPWEAWALLAKVNVPELLGAIVLALREHSVNSIKIVATTNHLDVLKARIRSAKKPGGYRDRNALDTALRFLPANKGATIIALPGGTAIAEGGMPQEIDGSDVDPDFLFPDLSETQKMLSR